MKLYDLCLIGFAGILPGSPFHHPGKILAINGTLSESEPIIEFETGSELIIDSTSINTEPAMETEANGFIVAIGGEKDLYEIIWQHKTGIAKRYTPCAPIMAKSTRYRMAFVYGRPALT